MKLFLTDLADITPDLINRYELLLSPAEKERYARITDANRRLQFLTGRALIYENCGETSTLSDSGKPLISKGYISLAHSGPYVALITSDTPVGLEDSSRVRPFDSIANRLGFLYTDHTDFYKNFTRYEADYKLGTNGTSIHHLFYSINTFIMCISLLNNKENIMFIKSIPFIRNTPFTPRILP